MPDHPSNESGSGAMRLLLVTFFAAALTAFVLFASANRVPAMRDSPGFADKEREIARRFENTSKQKFSLCLYPEGTPGAVVAKYHDAGDTHADGLRLVFIPRMKSQALGVHHYLTFNLVSSRFNDLSKERLEFYVKGVSGYPQVRRGVVLLRENSVMKSEAVLSYDITVDSAWQKVSLPIGAFKVTQDRFSWVIGEFLFSFEPIDDDKPAEFLIADAKIFGEDALLYEVF